MCHSNNPWFPILNLKISLWKSIYQKKQRMITYIDNKKFNIRSLTHQCTLLCFFKFVSRANNSKSCPPNKWPRHKNVDIGIFFGTNHPPYLRFLSRRGSRSLDMGLSQQYIGSKMIFCHFSNFCRKKFPSLSKRLLHIFIQLRGL